MFTIKLNLSVEIEGCPESGIPAIDFRRANRLPEAPTNLIDIPINQVSETVVRQFVAFADPNGDITMPDKCRYGNDCRSASTLSHSLSANGYVVRHVVSPAAILAVLTDMKSAGIASESALTALLAELSADKQSAAWKAETVAMCQQWIAKSPEERYRDALCHSTSHKLGERWTANLNIPQRGGLSKDSRYSSASFPLQTCRPELQALVDDIVAEIARRNAADVAAWELVKAASAQKDRLAKQAETDTLRNFAAAHGSEDLKFLVGNNPDQPELWRSHARREQTARIARLQLEAADEFCIAHPDFVRYGAVDWTEVDEMDDLPPEKLPLTILAQSERDMAAYPTAKVTVSRLESPTVVGESWGVFLSLPNTEFVARIIR